MYGPWAIPNDPRRFLASAAKPPIPNEEWPEYAERVEEDLSWDHNAQDDHDDWEPTV